jgi:hypothetical protein
VVVLVVGETGVGDTHGLGIGVEVGDGVVVDVVIGFIFVKPLTTDQNENPEYSAFPIFSNKA